MKLTYLSFTTILLLTMSGIDEIFAQFKVIKMEELRSMTSDGAAVHGGNGKGKLARNTNVTLIQIMPSERIKRRRSDKEIRGLEAAASELEIVSAMPLSDEEARSNNFLKLHILNVRTGKIQDAIISSDDERNYFDDGAKQTRQKSSEVSRKSIINSNNNGKREIIRIKPHSNQPETTFNEINSNKKFPVKPYKMRNKFKSSKCKCEDNSKMWNCRQIQNQIGRCRSDQFLCCSNYNQLEN